MSHYMSNIKWHIIVEMIKSKTTEWFYDRFDHAWPCCITSQYSKNDSYLVEDSWFGQSPPLVLCIQIRKVIHE